MDPWLMSSDPKKWRAGRVRADKKPRTRAQASRAAAFAPALARLQKLEKRMSDEQFVAQNGAWTMGLQFYALMQRRATTDGALAASLAPITSFFNYRHDSTKPTKLETRANAKLRDAQRLVARAKPRASVLEEEK